MLNLFGNRGSRTCDGVSRRDVLRIGSLALGGLALPDLLRLRGEAKAAGRSTKDTAVILV